MMHKKNNNDLSRPSFEPIETDYLKNRIVIIDNALQKVTQEKNLLSQELEEVRYQILKNQKENDSKFALKETEMRRLSNKIKPLELEFKNVNLQLNEERKKVQEQTRVFDKISVYMYESYLYINSIMQESIDAFKNAIFACGLNQKKKKI